MPADVVAVFPSPTRAALVGAPDVSIALSTESAQRTVTAVIRSPELSTSFAATGTLGGDGEFAVEERKYGVAARLAAAQATETGEVARGAASAGRARAGETPTAATVQARDRSAARPGPFSTANGKMLTTPPSDEYALSKPRACVGRGE